MFSGICFAIAVIVLAVFSVLAYQKRKYVSEAISVILAGVFLSTFFMVLPTSWVGEGEEVFSKPFYVILSSLLYSLDALGGGQDVGQLESIDLTGIFKALYIGLNYVCFVLAPVLTSSLLLSFVGDFGERFRFFLSRTPKCYIFSELNEGALVLARGIREAEGKKTIVFCNTKDTDRALVAEAKELGAITLYKPCDHLKLPKRFGAYEFYFLSENEDDNIALAEEIIGRKGDLRNSKITVNAFAQSGPHIQLLESMLKKKPCAVFESPAPELLEKAENVAAHSPNTEFVFFNVPEEAPEIETFSAKYPVRTYSGSCGDTLLDDSFRQYDLQLYYLRKTEEGREAAYRDVGYRDGHLVPDWQEEPLKLRFIDEIALFCNNLLYTHPLYNLPEGRKDISVLLVGCGRLGAQMLKTVVWCGQIPGYTLKIRVLDPKAEAIKNAIFSECPELDRYDILFESIDVESKAFEEKIREYADATFVCVATDSDERNIAAAENVYRIFHRNYSGYIPPIFARVRKNQKCENFRQEGDYLVRKNIEFFGTMSGVFSNKTLFNTELENLAFAVHLCYNWALTAPKESFEYQKALNDFYTSEYSRRSSMAAALHIAAKLRSCNLIAADSCVPTEEALADFEALVQDETVKSHLAKNEHDRWNAFVRSEGFRRADFETVKKYAPETRTHKDEEVKLHPCIVSWEELDALQQAYNALQQELNLKPSNFKQYDFKLVEEIPQIVAKAKQLEKEGW